MTQQEFSNKIDELKKVLSELEKEYQKLDNWFWITNKTTFTYHEMGHYKNIHIALDHVRKMQNLSTDLYAYSEDHVKAMTK